MSNRDLAFQIRKSWVPPLSLSRHHNSLSNEYKKLTQIGIKGTAVGNTTTLTAINSLGPQLAAIHFPCSQMKTMIYATQIKTGRGILISTTSNL